MTQLLWILVVLALVLLWRLAWRSQPLLAMGIGIGVLLGWIVGISFDAPSLDNIPIWLPPLPFAIVAFVLFFFGILAWFLGDDRAGGHANAEPDSRPDAPPRH